MAAERSPYSEVPPKTDCQPRGRPSCVLAPRADADFALGGSSIGYLTTVGLRGKDPFLCCNIAGTWGSASVGQGPRKPAVHRDHLVDGPKDREHPVSGMAKYRRISNLGHRMTDCSKSCPVPTPGDGQRLDGPSSGDRWTWKAAEDQPRDFATARATPLQIDGKVMHADAITSAHWLRIPCPHHCRMTERRKRSNHGLERIWDLLKSALLRGQVSLLAGSWESAAGVYL